MLERLGPEAAAFAREMNSALEQSASQSEAAPTPTGVRRSDESAGFGSERLRRTSKLAAPKALETVSAFDKV